LTASSHWTKQVLSKNLPVVAERDSAFSAGQMRTERKITANFKGGGLHDLSTAAFVL
jgi:hypothetical protein